MTFRVDKHRDFTLLYLTCLSADEIAWTPTVHKKVNSVRKSTEISQ